MPFAPAIALELSTQAPKAPPGIVATVTQAGGESAIRQIDVVFPAGFSYNERFRPPRCLPEQEAEQACPDGSKIGTVSGVSPLASASGNVYVTEDLRLVSFVSAAGGLLRFTVTGTITLDESGGFAVSFAGLPDIALSSLTLDLEDDDLALVKNPARCGDHRFSVTFSSYDGDVTTATPAVAITGCPSKLAVSRVRATRREGGVTLRWQVSPGTESTRVVLRRAGRRVRSRTVTGTSARFASLRPGRYVARLRATAGGRTSAPGRVAFAVRRR